MSLAVVIVLVVIALAFYAIYKVSRESNTSANSSGMTTPGQPTGLADTASGNDSQHLYLFELVRNMLRDSAGGDNYAGSQPASSNMIPLATIEAGVAHFKANYRGKSREQMVAIIDESLFELKARFGNEISAHDLRDFVLSQRQKLFPHDE